MDIPVRKLRYEDKSSALIDLKSKGVVNDKGEYINGTQAVVECGVITITQATCKEEIQLTPAVFADGYHYDIMTTDNVFFESEVYPKNQKYKFFKEI